MATVITETATIRCVHPGGDGTGTVQLQASQRRLTVDGTPVLVGDDLVGRTITGCTLTGPPGTVPCKTTVSMLGGGAEGFDVAGRPVLLDTAGGLTDSNPPGTWRVTAPGQPTLQVYLTQEKR